MNDEKEVQRFAGNIFEIFNAYVEDIHGSRRFSQVKNILDDYGKAMFEKGFIEGKKSNG